MPNWVVNYLVVTGDPVDIAEFKKVMAQPYHTYYPKTEFNKETQKWEDLGMEQTLYEGDFLFWNIISPEVDEYDDYFGNNGTTGSGSWYDWNITNWGVKWEASESQLTRNSDETTACYTFQTPWGAVPELLQEASRQYPTLKFDYEYEEEQGWGGEIGLQNGEVLYQSEYDIPTSHAELVERNGECWCEGTGEQMFGDCPEVEETEE